MGNRGLHGDGGKGLETPERRTGSGHRLRSSPLKVSGKTLQYESFVCVCGWGGIPFLMIVTWCLYSWF